MSDLTTTAALVGAIVVLTRTIEWLVRKPRGNDKPVGNGTRSAGRTAEEWDNRIEAAAERALVKGAAQRHADLEKLMEKVIRRELRDFREELRRR